MKLGCRRKDHNWPASLRIYANQTSCPLWPLHQLPNFMFIKCGLPSVLAYCLGDCEIFANLCLKLYCALSPGNMLDVFMIFMKERGCIISALAHGALCIMACIIITSPAPEVITAHYSPLQTGVGDAAANGWMGHCQCNILHHHRISTVLWLLCCECYLVYSVVGSVAEVEAAVAELLDEAVHLVHLAVLPVQLLLAAAAPPRQLPYCNIFC